jgi:hypothetical protein
VSMFEQVEVHELFTELGLSNPLGDDPNQLVINY